MSRLIDADELLSKLNEAYAKVDADYHEAEFDSFYGGECSAIQEIIKAVDEQPTAYDVDKVVEQLEEERKLSYADFDKYVEDVSPCLDAEYDDSFQRGLERAIKIIKRQVINNG